MPIVMVFSSSSAKKKMEQNNLTPAEFLRPFGEVGNLGGYTIRTNEKQERVKLENFRVNFIDSNLVVNPELRSDNKVIEAILMDKKPTLDDDIHEHSRAKAKDDLLSKIGNSRKGTEMEQTPWYSLWKQFFL